MNKKPVIKFVNKKNNKKNLSHLSDLNELVKKEDLSSDIIVFPDFHVKKGEMSPTGIAFSSRKKIYPSFTHLTVGSGISAWIIKGLDKKDFPKIKKIFHHLKKNIPGKTNKKLEYLPKNFNEKFFFQILINGASTFVKRKLLKNIELKNIENSGNFIKDLKKIKFNEINKFIPPIILENCIKEFGSLGTGNTFIELHQVNEVYCKKTLSAWNISTNDHILFVHSGSSVANINLFFTPRWTVKGKYFLKFEKAKWNYHSDLFLNKEIIDETINFFPGGSKFKGIELDSKLGEKYLLANNLLTNFSTANRLWLGIYFRKKINQIFKNTSMFLLWDSVHDSIKLEKNNKNIIHRHGASYCPFKKFGISKKIMGLPIIVPSSPGKLITVYKSKKKISNFVNSFSHGTGRKIDRPLARKKFNHFKSIKKITSTGCQIFFNSTDFSGEHPDAFNSINIINNTFTAKKIISPVLNTSPKFILKS